VSVQQRCVRASDDSLFYVVEIIAEMSSGDPHQCVCVCVYMSVYICVCMCVCMFLFVCVYINIYACVFLRVFACADTDPSTTTTVRSWG
jgi:hypothetical protein